MNWYEAEYRELFTPPPSKLIGDHFAKIQDIMVVWRSAQRQSKIQEHLEFARLGHIPDQELMRDIFERYLVFLVTRQRDTKRR